MSAETWPMVRCVDCLFVSVKRGSWCSRAQKHTTNAHWRRCEAFLGHNEGDVSVREDERAVQMPGGEGLRRRAAAELDGDTRRRAEMATKREVQTEPERGVSTAISVGTVRQMPGVEGCEIQSDEVIVRFHRHATSEQRIAVDRLFPESGAIRRRRPTTGRQKGK